MGTDDGEGMCSWFDVRKYDRVAEREASTGQSEDCLLAYVSCWLLRRRTYS